MNLEEYNKVKDMHYEDYCDYLVNKYGEAKYDYMSPKFTKNSKVSRTSDGLYAHHRMENRMCSLSELDVAKKCPWEWQAKYNLVYCDLLEHTFLHLLIAEEVIPKMKFILGFGGIIDYFVPELNDLYSGWETRQAWRKTCHSRVINDKEVYLTLIRRMIEWWRNENLTENGKLFDVRLDTSLLLTSMGARYGGWSNFMNKEIYKDISRIVDDVAVRK